MTLSFENLTTVVRVADEIDSWNAMGEIVDQVDSALAAGAGDVVIDLSNVTYADSIGVEALISADRLCRDRGVAMTLQSAALPVQRTLRLSEGGRTLTMADWP